MTFDFILSEDPTFDRYIDRIRKAWSISELNGIVEEAANDESLTNEEYERIYVAAINDVKEGKQQ